MEQPILNSSNNGKEPIVEKDSAIQEKQSRAIIIGAAIGMVVILALIVAAIFYLLQPNSPTSAIRDIVIIALGVELLFLGVAAVILIVQIARLVNLVQNEVQPVLEAANETINTLRGTAAFLSDNLIQPVIKVNGYIAVIKRMLGFINLGK